MWLEQCTHCSFSFVQFHSTELKDWCRLKIMYDFPHTKNQLFLQVLQQEMSFLFIEFVYTVFYETLGFDVLWNEMKWDVRLCVAWRCGFSFTSLSSILFSFEVIAIGFDDCYFFLECKIRFLRVLSRFYLIGGEPIRMYTFVKRFNLMTWFSLSLL